MLPGRLYVRYLVGYERVVKMLKESGASISMKDNGPALPWYAFGKVSCLGEVCNAG